MIGIDLKSFSLAGAFVIFLIAIEMILNIELFKSGDKSTRKVTEIVPLAFPLIAGSGTLTTLLSLKAIDNYSYLEIFSGLTINIIIVFIVLKMIIPMRANNWPGRYRNIKASFWYYFISNCNKIKWIIK